MASFTETDGSKKLLHYLDLNDYGLNEVPDTEKGRAKREVASYLKNEVLRYLSRGISPVKGEGRFRILNPEYARLQKGGVRTANLELEGDLKDSFKVEPIEGSFLIYGHEGEQVPKADGHNQISEKAIAWAKESEMPRRRYIPAEDQKFTDQIGDEITSILNDFKKITESSFTVEDFQDLNTLTTAGANISSVRESPESILVDTSNFFSDDIIEALLEDALRRRR